MNVIFVTEGPSVRYGLLITWSSCACLQNIDLAELDVVTGRPLLFPGRQYGGALRLRRLAWTFLVVRLYPRRVEATDDPHAAEASELTGSTRYTFRVAAATGAVASRGLPRDWR